MAVIHHVHSFCCILSAPGGPFRPSGVPAVQDANAEKDAGEAEASARSSAKTLPQKRAGGEAGSATEGSGACSGALHAWMSAYD